MRIVVIGGQFSGRESYAEKINPYAFHENDVLWQGMSEKIIEIMEWFSNPDYAADGSFGILQEIEKWLNLNDEGKPCDELIWLETSKKLFKHAADVEEKLKEKFNTVKEKLLKRGVKITYE